MKRTFLALSTVFALSLAGAPVSGHEGHIHEAVSAEKLGTVHFAISAGREWVMSRPSKVIEPVSGR